MFHILFPYSYVAVLFGALLGIGFATVAIGFVSAGIIAFLIYVEVIRITPLLDFFGRIALYILPKQLASLRHRLGESFKIRFTSELGDGRYIYTWHPHGLFSTSHFLHTTTNYTNWPTTLRTVNPAGLSAIQWVPFGKEILSYLSAIPSDYHTMKQALEKGNSISVAAGGMREMLGEHYIIKRRRGIFKMAIETGTPIVPILSFGEEKLFTIVEIDPRIQKWLEKFDICICIPTLRSVSKWFGMLHYPLKDPIISVAGKPIPVEQKDNPTEDDIAALRNTYIEALRELFTKENPNKSQTFSVI